MSAARDRAVQNLSHFLRLVFQAQNQPFTFEHQKQAAAIIDDTIEAAVDEAGEIANEIGRAPRPTAIQAIQKAVADHFHLHVSDMKSKRRPNDVAIPRQIAMYLCREITHASFEYIGQSFGWRDHGTVMHACKAVKVMIEKEPKLKASIEYLHEILSKKP